jgi:hypothetical protein
MRGRKCGKQREAKGGRKHGEIGEGRDGSPPAGLASEVSRGSAPRRESNDAETNECYYLVYPILSLHSKKSGLHSKSIQFQSIYDTVTNILNNKILMDR